MICFFKKKWWPGITLYTGDFFEEIKYHAVTKQRYFSTGFKFPSFSVTVTCTPIFSGYFWLTLDKIPKKNKTTVSKDSYKIFNSNFLSLFLGSFIQQKKKRMKSIYLIYAQNNAQY